MSEIRIYTSAFCPFCYRAKQLLDEKGVTYEEVDVTFSPDKRAEMAAEAGRTSVPQIWINGRHIGGSEELYALDTEGKLDGLIAETA
ncbi:MAG: glutaredoxin 3 [Alphaproteobacteria bacterium]|nr:glutaredoxin 3 [Alphaproteobacteria bacterium]